MALKRWGGGRVDECISMEKKIITSCFEQIISMENLLAAWWEFYRDKRNKLDAQMFGRHLIDHVTALQQSLQTKQYQHSGYYSFFIADPKPRHIHKASVRDRLVHHAIYRVLYPFFDRMFIADSFSCRNEKGTHRALNRFRAFAYTVSRNHTRTCWVLKLDIQKFFASIDHGILLVLLDCSITDNDIRWLLREVIGSFTSPLAPILSREGRGGRRGLPLGNLTSQLFANIYLNELDQFVKHRLKAKHYIRYADDFVFLSHDRALLESLIPIIRDFLQQQLRLTLHPKKIFLKTLSSGVDFLGWAHFPDHRVLRTSTKHRMLRRVTEHPSDETIASYLGLLHHGNANHLQNEVLVRQWLMAE